MVDGMIAAPVAPGTVDVMTLLQRCMDDAEMKARLKELQIAEAQHRQRLEAAERAEQAALAEQKKAAEMKAAVEKAVAEVSEQHAALAARAATVEEGEKSIALRKAELEAAEEDFFERTRQREEAHATASAIAAELQQTSELARRQALIAQTKHETAAADLGRRLDQLRSIINA